MAKALDFTKVKKSYLPVTFDDDAKTTIFVGTPTKAVMDELTTMQTTLNEIGEDGATEASTDDLFIICAKIMSRNRTGAKITKEFLENVFDFEDVIIFFNSYMDFVGEVIGQKN
jgi:hypothetical protein